MPDNEVITQERDEELETISVLDLEDPKRLVKIGRQGENLTQTVVIDCSAWQAVLGATPTFEIVARRRGEKETYQANHVTVSGFVVTWTLDSDDTAISGQGVAEIRGTSDTLVKKSAQFKTWCEASVEDYTAPRPVTPPAWANTVIEQGALAQTAYNTAQSATEAVAAIPVVAGEGTGSVIQRSNSTGVASGTKSCALGDDTQATGNYAFVAGEQSVASGAYSHAVGRKTTASGICAHAEGYQTIASGSQGSHAEGYKSKATDAAAHAEGNSTEASSDCAHAEGFATVASGDSAHAEGEESVASGYVSHAEGEGTIANHLAQHVFGRYNVADASAADQDEVGTHIEIVGKGTKDSLRSNARTLDWSGNEWVAGSYEAGGSLTLGKGTALEVTITAAQLRELLALLNT